jgi:hypothetical protein
MPERKFDLGDYVEVKDRIKLFYELYGQGRLVTGEVRLSNEPDGVARVLVQGLAYRTPDDPLPGVGWSWMELPGKTTYTKGSELENTETSAWGRAIGSLGILIDRSIASAQEVDNKAGESPKQDGGIIRTKNDGLDAAMDGLIGTAVAQGTQDFELRQSPEGWTLPFRIKNGTSSFIVLAEGEIAQAVATLKPTIIDQRVTVWGHWTDEVIPKKGTKPEIRYRVLHLERMATPDGVIPAPEWDTPDPTIEAPSIPLFDADEEANIDDALSKVPA